MGDRSGDGRNRAGFMPSSPAYPAPGEAGGKATFPGGSNGQQRIPPTCRFEAAQPRAFARTRGLTFRFRRSGQADLTGCNRSITVMSCSVSKHSRSSPLGLTVWQTPLFVALWSLGSSGLNEVFSATLNRWATVSPSFASISGPDGACTSRSGVASLLSCWLADPSAHRRVTSGARRRWRPCWIERGNEGECTNQD